MTRSRQSAKAAGTRQESAIVTFLSQWWPHVERRARVGAKDKGDITGIPGVCIEAKDHNRFDLAGWLDQAREEATNANASIYCAWFKRRGKASAGDGYVLVDGHVFARLLMEAGY